MAGTRPIPSRRDLLALNTPAEHRLTVDISDIKASRNPSDVLITYALGSCIAVIVYDPIRRIGGMIHYMLPVSSASPERAKQKPAMFADTGVPMLFEAVYALGAAKQDLVVKVAGGGALYDDNGVFNIGQRNYTILRKMFWKNRILIASEDVGGKKSRTVRLWIDTGRVIISSHLGEEEL
jgi:chemotaxis protein CheD